MKNYETMSAADLRAIAREHDMPGAWKATKAQMIEFLSNLDEIDEEIDEEIEETEDIAETHEDEPESIETESHETTQDDQENESDDDVAGSENVEEKPTPKRGALITFNGKEQNICAWAKELGISPNTLYGRIYKMGWTIERAFTTPARSK